MKLLMPGLRKFSAHVHPRKQTLFSKLAHVQAPHTMMISCSDSRIDPNLITQTEPGELFVLRNAGNIVPPYGSSNGGEQATIEFAVDGLKVSSIVICGHSFCGAMQTLVKPELLEGFPSLNTWLGNAEATRRRMKEIRCSDRLRRTAEENILVQIENIKTHPTVYNGIREKKLNIFGWFYDIQRGEIYVYDPKDKKFHSTKDMAERIDSDMQSISLGEI